MLRHVLPCSPYSKKGSIGTWTWHYGSKIQNEFEVCHSLLSKHSLADARGIFGGSLMGVYRCVKSRDTVYKRRHVLSFSWRTGAQCLSRIEWEWFVSNKRLDLDNCAHYYCSINMSTTTKSIKFVFFVKGILHSSRYGLKHLQRFAICGKDHFGKRDLIFTP